VNVSELVEKIEKIDGKPGVIRSVKIEHKVKERIPREKIRILYEPNEHMRQVHDLIRRWLRSQAKFPNYLPKSPVANIWPHRNNTNFYQVDIWNAYGSVTIDMLMQSLEMLGAFRGQIEHDIARLRFHFEDKCMAFEGGLAQGLPASTDLFNVCAAMLIDYETWRICRSMRIVYTRYVDDLTFSAGHHVFGWDTKRWLLRELRSGGFEQNFAKTTITQDLNATPVTITGLKLCGNGRIYVPRKYLIKLRGMLHMALKGAPIERDMVNGYMSVFWSGFGGRSEFPDLTATERHVWWLYRLYCGENIPSPDMISMSWTLRHAQQLHLFEDSV